MRLSCCPHDLRLEKRLLKQKRKKKDTSEHSSLLVMSDLFSLRLKNAKAVCSLRFFPSCLHVVKQWAFPPLAFRKAVSSTSQ